MPSGYKAFIIGFKHAKQLYNKEMRNTFIFYSCFSYVCHVFKPVSRKPLTSEDLLFHKTSLKKQNITDG